MGEGALDLDAAGITNAVHAGVGLLTARLPLELGRCGVLLLLVIVDLKGRHADAAAVRRSV